LAIGAWKEAIVTIASSIVAVAGGNVATTRAIARIPKANRTVVGGIGKKIDGIGATTRTIVAMAEANVAIIKEIEPSWSQGAALGFALSSAGRCP